MFLTDTKDKNQSAYRNKGMQMINEFWHYSEKFNNPFYKTKSAIIDDIDRLDPNFLTVIGSVIIDDNISDHRFSSAMQTMANQLGQKYYIDLNFLDSFYDFLNGELSSKNPLDFIDRVVSNGEEDLKETAKNVGVATSLGLGSLLIYKIVGGLAVLYAFLK